MYASANRVITCWAMGVTQHKEAVATIQDIANLHFLRGNIGRQGAGLVSGARSFKCAGRPHDGHLGQDKTRICGEKLEKEFDFKVPEKKASMSFDRSKRCTTGRAKVFFAMGGNFQMATPDTDFTADALRNCDLTAQVITKLNRTALVTGKKALDFAVSWDARKKICKTASNNINTTESTMLNVQVTHGILEPASEHLQSEPWIVGKLAQAVLKDKSTVDWQTMIDDYDLIRDSISRIVKGCENYNEKVKRPGGFYMPNPPRDGVFPTDTGKAIFKSSKLEKIDARRRTIDNDDDSRSRSI